MKSPLVFFFVFFAHAPLLYTLYVHTQPTKLCTREFTLDANEAAGLRRACTKQLVPLRKDERKKKKKKTLWKRDGELCLLTQPHLQTAAIHWDFFIPPICTCVPFQSMYYALHHAGGPWALFDMLNTPGMHSVSTHVPVCDHLWYDRCFLWAKALLELPLSS